MVIMLAVVITAVQVPGPAFAIGPDVLLLGACWPFEIKEQPNKKSIKNILMLPVNCFEIFFVHTGQTDVEILIKKAFVLMKTNCYLLIF